MLNQCPLTSKRNYGTKKKIMKYFVVITSLSTLRLLNAPTKNNDKVCQMKNAHNKGQGNKKVIKELVAGE